MIQVYGTASFESAWYWVLTLVVWSLVCHTTLGVPYDMIRRGRNDPEVRARVDLRARLAAERIGGVYDDFGIPIAALTGFGLAALAVIGFLAGVEWAQALFVLILPLVMVSYSSLRLGLAVRRDGYRGAALNRMLSRRQFWHAVFAAVSVMCALAAGLALHPSILMP